MSRTRTRSYTMAHLHCDLYFHCGCENLHYNAKLGQIYGVTPNGLSYFLSSISTGKLVEVIDGENTYHDDLASVLRSWADNHVLFNKPANDNPTA